MATVIASNTPSFHAPPANIDARIGNRKVYYRANMEHVTGVLGTSNGGTGNTKFENEEVVIYSGGKLISSGITKDELSALKGISVPSEEGDSATTLVDLLNEKVSGILTAGGVLLDKDDDKNVKLPDYLLKTGGTVRGNLEVVGDMTFGEHLTVSYDETTNSVAFILV